MPWSMPDNFPKVAKHWSDTEKRICTSAANSSLRKTGNDAKAIYACIGAVKNHRKKYKQGSEDEYDKLGEKSSKFLQSLVEALYAGEIVLDEFDTQFRNGLKDIYLRAMILARGDKEITEDDLVELQRRIDEQYGYFDGFMKDLRTGRYSQSKSMWRAALYGFPRGAYVYYSVPADVADLMPVLPGDDCLGICKCALDVSYDDDGTVYVDWVLDPLAEHCVVCLSHVMDSPYVFTAEQLLGE